MLSLISKVLSESDDSIMVAMVIEGLVALCKSEVGRKTHELIIIFIVLSPPSTVRWLMWLRCGVYWEGNCPETRGWYP